MSKPPKRAMLILHGVNGCSAELQSWAGALSQMFDVTLVNLAGHGGRPIPNELSVPILADDVLAQLDAHKLKSTIVLGYSFGGVIGMYLAAHHPSRVSGLITVASRWEYATGGVSRAAHLLQVERLEAMPQRRDTLARVHAPNDWRVLVQRLRAMYLSFPEAPPLTPDDLNAVTCPCLVVSGMSDPLVTVEETRRLRDALAGSDLAMYTGVAHPPERVPVHGLRQVVEQWAQRCYSEDVAAPATSHPANR